MPTLFHITPRHHIGKIAREGLQPRIGPRARLGKEPKPAIYCFSSARDLEDGLNWLEREFREEAILALLRITVPDSMPIEQDVPWESTVTTPVPPAQIAVLSRDMFGETDLQAVCAREGTPLLECALKMSLP